MLNPGTRLGPYEITGLIGAGGMGEVYRARDTRLDRDVAIKILPRAFAADANRRARFEREARAVSRLNHPNICTLFDVGQATPEGAGSQHAAPGDPPAPVSYLVMEHLAGETLADRLSRTRSSGDAGLPVSEALKIAIDIARALDAAHRAGITHRDLKPGNVMLTKSGGKLLDFGLALESESDLSPDAPPRASEVATASVPITAEGVIVGTTQYMAPEQLEGRRVDARADLFAFGAVVYEMVTGAPAFHGTSRASLIGAILKDEPPPLSTKQSLTPSALDFVVARCLAKDPDDRWQSAHDLVGQLEWISRDTTSSSRAVVTDGPGRPARHHRVRWIAAGIATTLWLVTSAGLAVLWFRPVPKTDIQFEITNPPLQSSYLVSVSPNGQLVAFVADGPTGSGIWIRPIASTVAELLPDTVGAWAPFWSPDSRSLAFGVSGMKVKVRRRDVSGSAATQTLCDIPDTDVGGGTWRSDGTIIFSTIDALHRIDASGTACTTIATKPAGEVGLYFPTFLPDEEHFIYVRASLDPRVNGLYVATLASPGGTRILDVASNVAFAPPGYLLFQRAGALVAQRFDQRALRIVGTAVPIVDAIVVRPDSGRAAFSVSTTGVLAYRRPGGKLWTRQLTWYDHEGNVQGTVGSPGSYNQVTLSPDEKQVALTQFETAGSDIWTLNLATGVPNRLTFDPAAEEDPLWRPPTGQTISFWSLRSGKYELYQRVLGETADSVLYESPQNPKYPDDWSRDGQQLLYHDGHTLYALPMAGAREPHEVIATPDHYIDEARFSPDARWIAYGSDETGAWEVYVTTFPPAGKRWQASSGGGSVPFWKEGGRELFYLSLDGKMMSVEMTPGPVPVFGKPTVLFQTPMTRPNLVTEQFAVTRDGRRFLILVPVGDAQVSPLTVVADWTTLLTRRR